MTLLQLIKTTARGLLSAIALLAITPLTHAAPPIDAQGIQRAIEAQERNNSALFERKGLVGTGVGVRDDGTPVIKIFVENRSSFRGLPRELDGVPTQIEITGKVYALAPPSCKGPNKNDDGCGDGGTTDGGTTDGGTTDGGTTDGGTTDGGTTDGGTTGGGTSVSTNPRDKFRPVRVGVSSGFSQVINGYIYGGTLGAFLTDGTNTYALSNNHVYANEGTLAVGAEGAEIVQPARIDGGAPIGDKIGRLNDFVPLDPDRRDNKVDAAIALLDSGIAVCNETPPNGYGPPGSTPATASVGAKVLKYGRTTGYTRGRIEAVNVSVNVGFDAGSVRFVEQIAIKGSKGKFSDSGDSGSLIVMQGDNAPVGLLFAGGGPYTYANRIQNVLSAFPGKTFGVASDGCP